MENQYDVGIANRYALFLEEGENSLTAIKKKLSKETRQKNKAIRKENAEARKAEAAKALEKPEPQPEAIEVSAPKKEKEEKAETPKSKEKKSNDVTPNRKDKESQDKSRNVKNGGDAAAVVDSWDAPVDAAAAPEPVAAAEKEFAKPYNENGPPRKNYERRPPRERKFENSDQNQSSKPYNNQYNKRNYNNSSSYNNSNSGGGGGNNGGGGGGNNSGGGGGNFYNKDDDWGATKTWDENEGGDGGAAGDNATNRYQSNENRNVRENGYGGPHTGGEYRPRGGGGRFRGDSRGGRRYNGPDRRKEYNNDQQIEPKDETNVFKGDSWADENTENTNTEIPTDNQKDEENKGTENDASGTDEQKEVKEFLTLDEWKKLQGERQKPQYNLRKAGEGEDLTQWKNMRELEKKKDEEFLETNNRHPEKSHDHEKENAGNENVQRVGRQKHIDINVHFRESSSRGRGGRIIRNNRFGGGYKPRNEYRSDGNDRDRNDRNERDRFDRNDRNDRNDRDRYERNDRNDRERFDRNDRNDRERFDRNDRERFDRNDRNDRDRFNNRDRYERNDRERFDRNDRNDSNTYGGETRSFRKPREPREPREGGYVGRGGGNRGPPAARQNAPKMDDESAFPSLG